MAAMIAILAVLIALFGWQQDPEALAAEALALYAQGDYQAAAAVYEAILSAGVRDGLIYLNLGHAYLAQQDIGWALVNYRRAQLLLPRDADVNEWLARVRAQRRDIQGEELAVVDGLTALTLGVLRWDELVILTGLLWAGFFALLTTYLLRSKWREVLRVALLINAVILLWGLVLVASRSYSMSQRPPGVIVAEITPVMSGPGDDYLEIYRLYAAAELRVLEKRGEWVRFVLPDERQGWVQERAVALVAGADQ